MSTTALEKYNARVDAANSLVCVGLDPEFEKIPEPFRNDPTPQFAFNKHIIDVTHEHAAAYKPNMAFYESRGDQGIRELKLTLEYLRANHPDILTICDAKRGDTANTNEHYAKAVFDWFGFDAITLSPYLGSEPLKPFLERADKASIILCRTSNPGSPEVQDLAIQNGAGGSTKPLWQSIAEKAAHEWNANNNCMLVVGATYPPELQTIRSLVGEMTLLVPGIGAQGGDTEATVRAGVNSARKGIIVNSSRGIIFGADPGAEAKKLKELINQFR